jgi:uncharacterized protein (TIGR00375 family)
MIEVVDLHIHSHYSMATSKDMDLDHIAYWAKRKGLTIVATGDVTHPLWVNELRDKLTDLGNGFFEYKNMRFVLAGEVNVQFKYKAKVRKVHIVITIPSFNVLKKVNLFLHRYGNLEIDGRPTLFINGMEFVRGLKDISPDIHIIPAHIWTPWFGLFGSKSGFDRIEDCFGEETTNITALETGLSSDPFMNYIVRDIDEFTLVSNSDAHSPENLGREANVMKDIHSYNELFNVIKAADKEKFLFTIEFFPEEGKYFGDGHRKCNIHFVPENSDRAICPVCKRPLTYGVFHRVMESANWEKKERKSKKIPYKHIVPLKQILSQVLNKGVKTKTVSRVYDNLVDEFGSELNVLVFEGEKALKEKVSEDIFKAIYNMRHENVHKEIGYDGVYGKIILTEGDKVGLFD